MFTYVGAKRINDLVAFVFFEVKGVKYVGYTIQNVDGLRYLRAAKVDLEMPAVLMGGE